MTINEYNFAGKKAIVRVDFNVPLKEGVITDDTRIRGAVPTLKHILDGGGALIIMSHMGKPKGKVKPELSLGQIKDAVAKALGVAEVKFAPDCAKAQEAAANLKMGEVLLLENLRYYPEEEGKPVGIDKEDPAYKAAKEEMKGRQKDFAKTLASYADCYAGSAAQFKNLHPLRDFIIRKNPVAEAHFICRIFLMNRNAGIQISCVCILFFYFFLIINCTHFLTPTYIACPHISIIDLSSAVESIKSRIFEKTFLFLNLKITSSFS